MLYDIRAAQPLSAVRRTVSCCGICPGLQLLIRKISPILSHFHRKPFCTTRSTGNIRHPAVLRSNQQGPNSLPRARNDDRKRTGSPSKNRFFSREFPKSSVQIQIKHSSGNKQSGKGSRNAKAIKPLQTATNRKLAEGFEPSTSSLPRTRSTPELRQQMSTDRRFTRQIQSG